MLRIEVEQIMAGAAPVDVPMFGTLMAGEMVAAGTQSGAVPAAPGAQRIVVRLRNTGTAAIFVRAGYRDPNNAAQLTVQPGGAGGVVDVALEPRRRLEPGEVQVGEAPAGMRFIWSAT